MEVTEPRHTEVENTRPLGVFLRDVMKANMDNFRVFGPDENTSNKLNAIYEVSKKFWITEYFPEDSYGGELSPEGRVMEMLSEHTLEGWMEGYLLTGRHAFFSTYESFVHVIDSMVNQHCKWLEICKDISWREEISSLNLLITSTVWRQDHNGFTYQDSGFLDVVVNKIPEVTCIYVLPDVNTLLSVADHCLRSENCVNVIVSDKQLHLQYMDLDGNPPDDGQTDTGEVACPERENLTPTTLGLNGTEGKTIFMTFKRARVDSRKRSCPLTILCAIGPVGAMLTGVTGFVPSLQAAPESHESHSRSGRLHHGAHQLSFDQFVQKTLQDYAVPGAVVVEDNTPILLQGHGVRQAGKPERVNADTRFQIGSVGKLFTATALGVLVDELAGKIDWDTPIIDYMPEFALKDASADDREGANAPVLALGCTVILRGALPTGMVAATCRLLKSTTETSLEPSLVTYAIRPSVLMASQWGALPTFSVALTTLFVASIMLSSPGPWLTTSATWPSGANRAT